MVSGSGGNSKQPAPAVAAVVRPTSFRKSRRLRGVPIGWLSSLMGTPRLFVACVAVEARRRLWILAVRLVTGDTEAHGEIDRRIDDVHLLHRPVTGLALHAGFDVPLVTEMH